MWSPKRLVLWEPRTGTEIALPPMPLVVRVFLSGDPLGSPLSGWMSVAPHMTVSIDNKVSFLAARGWRLEPRVQGGTYNFHNIQSVAFHGGKMYCIESMRRIAVYDLSRVDAAASPPVLLEAPCIHYARAAHFVACNGDLLFVLLPRHRHNFPDVYNLEPLGVSTTGRHRHRQELDLRKKDMVTDLGGYSLFLGRGDTFALSAKEHPAIRGNCIYYVPLEHHGFNRKKWSWAFVFDFESRAVDKIKFPPEHVENREVRWWPCSWFCPQKPILLKHR
uniref:KIB1-4 beta-propeller domain-containing protein n=1 Tax=Setaria viridis TaxID=4556 RepID=A0A4U6TDQ4_SETVI|nr:hypothetical protein SEVIR_9G355400v2 [Setaria viridis]